MRQCSFKVWLGAAVVFFSIFVWADNKTSVQVEHPYITEYKKHLDVLRKSFEPHILKKSIRVIKQVPTLEAYEILFERLERLPDIAEVLEIPDLKRVINQLLQLLENIGTQDDIEMLLDFAHWVEIGLLDQEVLERVAYTAARLSERLSFTLRTVDQFNKDLISNEALGRSIAPRRLSLEPDVDPRQKAHEAALREVDQFYQTMRRTVIGQDAILESMETLYLQDLLKNGVRYSPEVFYLMGLPGNGKDTIAEAYVDALWDKKGAHRDHLFRMNIRNKAEAWSYFGSGKGYIGSSDLPEFLRFLVQHSGGKYALVEEGDPKEKRLVVVKNPNWNEKIASMVVGPHKAVVFVNEAHNIPKEVKDNVLKQAIERGIFPITNPGSGPNAVSHIELPVTFIFASNEGIDLLEPRQRNGSRFGDPLSFDVVYDNYLRVFEDKLALKQAILKTNGAVNDMRGADTPGTSEEFLNRIPNHRLHLLEPLSPEQLKGVARLLARDRIKEVSEARGRLGRYKIEISDEMYDFISTYHHIASENARPIKARLDNYVFEPIFEAIRSKRIRPLGREQTIFVDVKKYGNGARSSHFTVTDEKSGTYQFSRLIRETLGEVPKSPLPIERIQELTQMRDRMLQNVFGVEHIVDRLLEAAIVSESESRNSGQSTRPATVMAFLGKSSTGKTETAKQYVKARYGDEFQPVIIDFNGVRSLEAVEAKILGSYDANKNPIASEFMKQYDRARGKITFIFDEAANAPKDLLKALYEITREASPTGFTDGKARPMKNVTIIMTGNAGEQIYDEIPHGLPSDVKERALNEVFKTFIRNEDLQHRILMQTFPEALLARLGQNIFHFGPLQDDGKRQIAQLKLVKGLKSLLPKPSERGWKVGFASKDDLHRLFDVIEKEGFRLNEQGASIDKFIRESIIDKIKSRLLLEGVANGQEIHMEVVEKPIVKTDKGAKYYFREIKLHNGFGQTYSIEVPTGQRSRMRNKTDEDRVLTAYHEAGHEIVSNVYFGDRYRATYLSIIEGVALIGKSFIPYNGVSMGMETTETAVTKEVILRRAAVLAAGYVAQQLVTIGSRHDSGKSNDMLRATGMIQNAILRYGLSSRWGMRAIPDGVSTNDFIAKELTATEKELLNNLTKEWLAQAEKLAKNALLANFDSLFIDMSKAIAQEGQLHGPRIEEIYENSGVITERDGYTYDQTLVEIQQVHDLVDRAIERQGSRFHKQFTEETFNYENVGAVYDSLAQQDAGLLARFLPFPKKSAWDSLSPKLQKVAASRISHHIKTTSRDARLASDSLMPESVANIDSIITKERAKLTEPVTNLELFQISENQLEDGSLLGEVLMCRQVFL